ncbi:MAG: class I SAM-dependent methyltransferase [Gemmatimonadota bacterium]
MTLSDLEAVELVNAAGGGEPKRAYVRRMFSAIAPRYDLLNHLLSFNIDRRWRRLAISALGWERAPRGVYLDLCAGTLDVAVELARAGGFGGRVIGADFAEPMLRAGLSKVEGWPVDVVVADAMELPVPDASIDGVIVAFGVRNLPALEPGLSEMRRVLAPEGRLVILEFSTPPSALVRGVYHAYFHRLLPLVGGLVSGHRTAYRYLPESVRNFPTAQGLADKLHRCGFSSVQWRQLTFGIAALHVASRESSQSPVDVAA